MQNSAFNRKILRRPLWQILSLALVFITSGCATVDTPTEGDRFESYNRTMYDFNKSIDSAVLKPLAEGYDAVAPEPVKQSVSNFFANLDDVPTAANQFLQGKFLDGVSDLGRFVINSTIGLAGLFDVASKMGIEAHDEDFGQTLGAWGFNPGPYVVLPFLGPSTFRDTLAMPVDNNFDVLQEEVEHIPTRNTLYFMNLLDLRYRLLAVDGQLEDAIDEYSFVRDAFLMRREYLVYDGNPPEDEDFYDDCFDEEECDDEIID